MIILAEIACSLSDSQDGPCLEIICHVLVGKQNFWLLNYQGKSPFSLKELLLKSRQCKLDANNNEKSKQAEGEP